MCGRYTLTTDHGTLAALPWPLAPGFEWRPRYNLAPTQWAPVVADLDGWCVSSFRWGLIPHWAKDPKIGQPMINARVESVQRSPAYKVPLRRRRCLVLADGFFEWKQLGGKKTPIYIRRGDGGLLIFAGLWDRWVSDEGEEIRSFTVLTGPPNEQIRPIHDRMPVILSERLQEAWLRDEPDDTLPELQTPREIEGLEAYPVSRAVNSPANDDPTLIESVGDALGPASTSEQPR